MSLQNRIVACLILIAGLALPTYSFACDGCGGFGSAYVWNYHRMPLRTGNVPSPPYFALHPPVYYSGLQYRPYGDSPFACPPCQSNGGVRYYSGSDPSRPIIIENPHYQHQPAEQQTSRAQTIINPYYQPAATDVADID